MLKYVLSLIGFLFVLALVFNTKPLTQSEKKPETGIVFNSASLNHDRIGHLESAHRLTYIKDFFAETKILKHIQIINERPASQEELLLAHDLNYIQDISNVGKTSKLFFTNDKWSPYVTSFAFQAAATAAGSLVELSEKIAQGDLKNGFAIVRPPGHHATYNSAMGYCIFNNIGIAAENLLKKKLAYKILIVDTDAHFGNGIAMQFWNNPNVFYISHNQEWLFPYSQGKSNLNIKDIKVKFLFPEKDYLQLFKKNVNESIEKLKPDFIFVSAGYDSHWRDPMSNLSLTLTGYAEISQFLVEKAQQYSSGKIVFSLEGGYDLDVLKYGTYNTVQALLRKNEFIDPIGPKTNP
jgi:acetoin utilization deacetylase AcuC-like enzyme